MIDLYFAEFHIELIEAEGGKLVTVDCAMMREPITRLRQAEKDAARYRWLRDLPGDSAHEEIGNYPGDMWDDAIDEAMQCSK